MSEYSIRLELNGNSDGKIYDKLHAAMAAKGFVRYVGGESGKKYQLPHGNYWKVSSHNLETIHGEALTAATSIWADVDLLVTLDGGSMLNLKDYVEPKPAPFASALAGIQIRRIR